MAVTTAAPRRRPLSGPGRVNRRSPGPHYARLKMFGLALAGDGDLPRVSGRGVKTESSLCARTMSLAAVNR